MSFLLFFPLFPLNPLLWSLCPHTPTLSQAGWASGAEKDLQATQSDSHTSFHMGVSIYRRGSSFFFFFFLNPSPSLSFGGTQHDLACFPFFPLLFLPFECAGLFGLTEILFFFLLTYRNKNPYTGIIVIYCYCCCFFLPIVLFCIDNFTDCHF